MMLRPKRWGFFALLAAFLMIAAACGDKSDPGSGDGGTGGRAITVVATDFKFDTKTIEVEPGETISLTLQNDGEAPHTFDSDGVGIDVATDPGSSASGDFTAPNEAGTFEFHCDVHPTQMKGEIVVGGGGAGAGGSTDTTEDTSDTSGGY
jgi:plastocyanin